MRVTYNEILAAQRAILTLIRNGAATVAPLAALRLARAARIVDQEAQAFEIARLTLVRQYAPEPDDQGDHTVPPPRMREFSDELAVLLKESVEVDVQLLDLADFGNCQISLTSLIGMEWLINA
jgi:hypothetical protein